MENCEFLCPALYHAIYSSHLEASALFISQKKLLSREATLQGNPLAMAMHGIAVLLLIERVEKDKQRSDGTPMTDKWQESWRICATSPTTS